MAQTAEASSRPVAASAPYRSGMVAGPPAAAQPAAGDRASGISRSRWARLGIHTILVVGAITTAFPFYWMVVTSFKTNSEAITWPPTFLPLEWHAENYLNALQEAPFGRYFLNTAYVALWTVVGVLVVSSLAAYAFARMQFYGKNALFTLFLATLMIPAEVTLIPNFVIITKWLNWYNTYQAQFAPYLGNVFAIFLLRQFFMTVPRELEDAALIDGCSRLRFLWAIVLPLSRPALITVALLNFLNAWNAFLWPLIVTRSAEMRPIQLGLQVFSSEFGSRYAELMAASTLVILPTVALYLVAQRYFVEGIARTGLRG
ncbi:MAG: carbohydrate ABC transporter permease [Chloroflexota bacterium]